MADDTQNDTPDYQAQIEKLKAENATYREQRRELRGKVDALQPLADKAAEYEQENQTEQERAAAELAGYKEEIEAARAMLGQAKQSAAFNKYLNDADVDPAHTDMLRMAVGNMPLDDAEAMTELLAPYARKRGSTPVAKVKAPAGNGAVSLKQFGNLSVEDRLAAYGQAMKG